MGGGFWLELKKVDGKKEKRKKKNLGKLYLLHILSYYLDFQKNNGDRSEVDKFRSIGGKVGGRFISPLYPPPPPFTIEKKKGKKKR